MKPKKCISPSSNKLIALPAKLRFELMFQEIKKKMWNQKNVVLLVIIN